MLSDIPIVLGDSAEVRCAQDSPMASASLCTVWESLANKWLAVDKIWAHKSQDWVKGTKFSSQESRIRLVECTFYENSQPEFRVKSLIFVGGSCLLF